MKTIEIEAYEFDELDPDVQEDVIEKYYDEFIYDDWYECVVYDMSERLKKEFDLYDFKYAFDIYYAYAMIGGKLPYYRIDENGRDDVMVHIKMLNNGKCTIEFISDNEIAQEEEWEMYDVVEDWLRKINREFYEELKAYYDEISSDEGIAEAIRNSDCLFLEDGYLIPRKMLMNSKVSCS
ncbi:MAG: hypothetical protein QXS54_06725 [Candidatus Methanomethylicaceae archaeon]